MISRDIVAWRRRRAAEGKLGRDGAELQLHSAPNRHRAQTRSVDKLLLIGSFAREQMSACVTRTDSLQEAAAARTAVVPIASSSRCWRQTMSVRTLADAPSSCSAHSRTLVVFLALSSLTACGNSTTPKGASNAQVDGDSSGNDVVDSDSVQLGGDVTAPTSDTVASPDAFVPPDGGAACQEVDCDDKSNCTDDWCEAGKCKHQANTATCDDGNACTTGDVCKGGTCTAGPKSACEDGNICTDDSCDTAANACVHKPNTVACDDGKACTVADACDKSACVAGKGKDCDDKNACTDDTCDATSGACQHTPKPGCVAALKPCTQTSECDAGVCDVSHHVCVPCVASADCGGGYNCAKQQCVASKACSSGADCKVTKQVCDKTDGVCVDCVSANDCGTDQLCVQSTCVAAPACKSDKDCTGVCDTGKGVCVGCVATADCKAGTWCAPWQECVAVVCSGQACLQTTLFACAADGSGYGVGNECKDDVVCTDDKCDPAAGCLNLAAAGSCDDGNACTDDSCQKIGGCKHVANTGLCDDSNACTTADACWGAACTGKKKDCGDGNPCTEDTCDTLAGCKSGPPTCDDAQECTVDSCYLPSGCTHVSAPDGAPCGTSGSCTAGICVLPFPASCGDMSGLQQGAPWPMLGGCPTHQGRSPYVGAQTNNLKWKFKLSDQQVSSPTVGSDGTVYVGSYDAFGDRTYAIDTNGKQKWKATGGDGHDSSAPALGADGTVYTGSSDGLYAIDSGGKNKWQVITGKKVASAPVIGPDGVVYFGSDDSYVRAVAPNGQKKWQFYAGYSVRSSPALGSDGTVYFVSEDGNFYAVDSAGQLKWQYPTGTGLDTSPAIAADGTLLVGAGSTLVSIGQSGKDLWTYGGWVMGSPAIGSDGTAFVGAISAKKVFAVGSDGKLKWLYWSADEISGGAPAIGADGTVYAASQHGSLFAIDVNGQNKWTFSTGSSFGLTSPAIGANGVIYVASKDGYLYAIGK